MPSDIDVVITETREIESLLSKYFDSEGRGLHQKITSASSSLDASLVKKLRWIATIRNKVVHENNFEIPNRDSYIKACEECKNLLQRTPDSIGFFGNFDIDYKLVAVIATMIFVLILVH
jgi:hypothetical protein